MLTTRPLHACWSARRQHRAAGGEPGSGRSPGLSFQGCLTWRHRVRRRVHAEDEHRDLHHLLVIQRVPVYAVFTEALAVVGAYDDGGGPAAALNEGQHLPQALIEVLHAGNLPAEA